MPAARPRWAGRARASRPSRRGELRRHRPNSRRRRGALGRPGAGSPSPAGLAAQPEAPTHPRRPGVGRVPERRARRAAGGGRRPGRAERARTRAPTRSPRPLPRRGRSRRVSAASAPRSSEACQQRAQAPRLTIRPGGSRRRPAAGSRDPATSSAAFRPYCSLCEHSSASDGQMNYSRVVLLDCDIHLGYNTLADLLAYLDPPTRELVVSSGTNGLAMPSYPWNHPTGWIRHDLYERSADHEATFAHLTLETLRERHLDLYDVTLGIVDPDEAAAFSVIPNAQLPARLCSAYNDWLLERWLQEEQRLRAMIVVPAQYPEAAAHEIRRLG